MSLTTFARVALAALLTTAGLSILAPTAAQAATVRVMPLGDSITGSPGCWRAYLWRQLQAAGRTDVDMVGTLNNSNDCGARFDGDNEGHGGYLVTTVASDGSFRNWVNADRPDVILMHFGTNDVWSNRSPAAITAAYGQIVDQARAVNPRVKFIVAKILPVAPSGCSGCPAQTVALNNAIPGWAASKTTSASPITVVDQWTGWNSSSLTVDGVHPNDAGHQRMAAIWYPALISALSGTTPTTPTTTVPTTRPTTPAPSATGGTAPNGYPYCARGSASDPDGDGWGWENNASCVVRGSAADPGRSTTTPATTRATTASTAPTRTTPPASTAPNPGGNGSCNATFTVANSWAGGFVATVNVTATTQISGWTVSLRLPSGTAVSNGWNGDFTGTQGTVTVHSQDWNGRVAPGSTSSSGFQATGSSAGVLATCMSA